MKRTILRFKETTGNTVFIFCDDLSCVDVQPEEIQFYFKNGGQISTKVNVQTSNTIVDFLDDHFFKELP